MLNIIQTAVNWFYGTIIPGGSQISETLGNVIGLNGLTPVDAMNGLLVNIFQRLPDGGGLPTGVHEGAIYFGNTLAKLNFMLPVDVLMSCLIIIFSLKILLFGFHLVMFVVNLIRGIPTSRFDGTTLPDAGYATVGERTAKFWG